MKTQTAQFFSLACIAFCLASCCKEKSPNLEGHIRFDNLQVGQKSRYLAIKGANYFTSTDDFAYSPDTLTLEIVGQDANGFLVEESLVYSAELSPWLEYDKDEVLQYYLQVTGDSLRIVTVNNAVLVSRMFWYQLAKNALPLQAFSEPKIDIQGWNIQADNCICLSTGYTENYTQLDKTYSKLNIVIDNTSMVTDGPGETYVYSKSDGIVRAAHYSPWTQAGVGWDLLP